MAIKRLFNSVLFITKINMYSPQVTPASGVSGDCYVLGKSDDVAQAEEEPEEEEVDDGGKSLIIP